MSLGALTRYGFAGLASYAAADYVQDPLGAVVTALSSVASSYLVNRVNAVEDSQLDDFRASRNHHLQIALAGSFRTALNDIHASKHQAIFAAWDQLLEEALANPMHLLGAVIPADFDALIDGTNRHIDATAPFEEAQHLLGKWLAYQLAYATSGSYPMVPPPAATLPADLVQLLRDEFPPAFQRAFAHLLANNDQEYARRAFERRALEKIDATTRDTHAIVKRIEGQLREQTPPPPARIRRFTSKLPVVDRTLLGREKELAFLDEAWANPDTNVVQIIASGGTGKTALMDKWFRRHLDEATVFGWSFYSQGTSEDRQTSSDPFFDEAFRFFKIDIAPTASVYAKADALAEKLRQERVLLLLDGVEPLQDSSGDLKDQALKALLQELDTHNAGLVLCTTRYRINELPDDSGRVLSWNLDNLSPEASLAYLRKIGVSGEDEELLDAAKEYGHHALALTLLGHYLVNFCEADVRRAVEIPKLMVDELKQGRHARRIMAAYEETFAGQFELDILKGLGYFNRPAEPEALKLVMPKMAPLPYLAALKRLRDLRLVLDDEATESLDCHPLVREHFAMYAMPEGHRLLYEHYRNNAPYWPDEYATMTPLLYATYHGCRANRHEEALLEVYEKRIRRGEEGFLYHRLGAWGSDVSQLANFFTTPWTEPAKELSLTSQAWVTGNAAFSLRAIGRLADAVEPMYAGADGAVAQEEWLNAAIGYSNLGELLLTLGRIDEAIAAGRRCVQLAESSRNIGWQMATRTTLADALHKSGDMTAAARLFEEAEILQARHEPWNPTLSSLWGYRYCDLLVSQGKQEEVHRRSTQNLKLARHLLSIALGYLSLTCAGDSAMIELAVEKLRSAAQLDYLPLGLLARGTQRDLDEVYKIATRSCMRLHLTDYHLKQAELDLREGRRERALYHADEADKLIQATGYHRRDPELAALREKLRA